MYSISKS